MDTICLWYMCISKVSLKKTPFDKFLVQIYIDVFIGCQVHSQNHLIFVLFWQLWQTSALCSKNRCFTLILVGKGGSCMSAAEIKNNLFPQIGLSQQKKTNLGSLSVRQH